MNKNKIKKFLKKTWHFIWHEDSVWSWLVNIILAFVLIKFIVFPFLGLVLSTSHPIVAVVSESMEHDLDDRYSICGKRISSYEESFDGYWKVCGDWYEQINITKGEFKDFEYSHGFNKGDIMVLRGKDYRDIEVGEVLVFNGGRKNPIIHRAVKKWKENNKYYFQTKGDHNPDSISTEKKIGGERIVGTVLFRIPYLGWIKIIFVRFLSLFGINLA